MCVPAAVPSGLLLTVAEEARRAGALQRGAQHLEGFQPQELLPVPLQRRPDHHQEEKVSAVEPPVLARRQQQKVLSARRIGVMREGAGGQLIQTGPVGEELGGMCEWPC